MWKGVKSAYHKVKKAFRPNHKDVKHRGKPAIGGAAAWQRFDCSSCMKRTACGKLLQQCS